MSVEITFEEPADSGQLQSIMFDAVTRDAHESSATVTEHPVEEGANISDHVRPDLDRVTLEAVVSNTPVGIPTTQMEGVEGRQAGLEIVDSVTNIVLAKASVLVFDGEIDRVRTVYEELLRLEKAGVIVGIVTSLREYENMLIRRVSPIREASTGNALFVTVEATEIRIATSEVVAAPDAEQTRDGTRSSRGRQQTSDSDDSTDTRSRSLLIQLGDTLRALVGPNDGAPS